MYAFTIVLQLLALNAIFVNFQVCVNCEFAKSQIYPKKFLSKRSVLDNLSSEQLREIFNQIRKEEAFSQKQCSKEFSSMESHIIRTKDSIKNGATFLKAVPNIESAAECRDKCCSYSVNNTNLTCNVAVFQLHQIDEKPRCFLFDCFNSSQQFTCFFSVNSGFTSFKNPQSKVKSDQVVEELEDVVKTSTHVLPSTLSSTASSTLKSIAKTTLTSTTQSTVAKSFSTTSLVPTTKLLPVSTVSPSIKLPNKIETKTSPCAVNKCQRLEWQCDNKCCISFRQLCDGVHHCSDGSDEATCPTLSTSKSTTSSQTPKYVATKPTVKVIDVPQSKSTEKVETKNVDFPPSNSAIKEEAKVIDLPPSKTDKKEKAETTDLNEINNKNTKVSNSDETAEKPSTVDPEAGAVLPLAIGLAITGCILIMVACRVRTMKKKLRRRGKPLSMDESDYLINGMYL